MGRPRGPPPQERSITINAMQYAYDPAIVRVNRGDRIRIRLVAFEVTHGFFLDGYDLDVQATPMDPTLLVRHPATGREPMPVQEIEFVADRAGKFHYRCSVSCGVINDNYFCRSTTTTFAGRSRLFGA